MAEMTQAGRPAGMPGFDRGTGLRKTPVLLTILLTFITLGVYYPCWFLSRLDAINSLLSREKLGRGVFVFAVLLAGISILLNAGAGVLEGLGEGSRNPDLIGMVGSLVAFDRFISLTAGVLLLIQSFKVKRIFQQHFNEHLNQNVAFSSLATFFFQIYYLQYKINRFDRASDLEGAGLSEFP